MKFNKYFDIREFIPESEYNKIMKLSEDDRLNAFYKLINPKIIEIATYVRELFGKPMIINNWHTGGTYTLRGWRPLNCPVGAKKSLHKKGKAFDFDIKGLSDDEVKDTIIKHEKELYKIGVRRMESREDAGTWCHLDIQPVKGYTNKIYVFNA